jgi:hypothetical protein
VRLITFLSDFGTTDTYVGQVKGAIATAAPGAAVVDLTHQVPAQDVRAGAFLLWTAVEVFPPGSIHLAVVDPGVGTSRRAVAVRSARGDLFVGPDNGLLPMAVARLGGAQAAVELTNSEFHRAGRSDTFHGRDLFGPVAGFLARGTDVELLGRETGALASPYELRAPRREPDRVVGHVLHVDGYGNLITSLTPDLLPPRFEVVVGDRRIRGGLAANYQSVETGDLLAVVGSAGLLELSVRDGSAALMLGLERDAPVVVRPFAP